MRSIVSRLFKVSQLSSVSGQVVGVQLFISSNLSNIVYSLIKAATSGSTTCFSGYNSCVVHCGQAVPTAALSITSVLFSEVQF